MSDSKIDTFEIAELPVLSEQERPDPIPRVTDRAGISEAFFEITRALCNKYDIDKGVLVLRQGGEGGLAAISTWHHGSERDGLALNLPTDNSLFDKVAEDGRVYTQRFCGEFSGNFFEKKLLLDDDTEAFVLHPLKSDGEVLGLLGYSSRTPSAFAMFEEGAIESFADRMGSVIRERTVA